MNDFLTFVQFGFRHIVDVAAMDHILFLVALAAIYRWRDARSVFLVVTAFTIGHSITLALAVTGALVLPSAVIEFLIPVTIVLTGLANLWSVRARRTSMNSAERSAGVDHDVIRSHAKTLPLLARLHRPLLAGFFGLIHGAGFANYLKALFVDDIAAPLLGFNVGIEFGQVVVLLATAALLAMLDTTIKTLRLATNRWPALALRTATVSLLVVTIGTAWAVERSPW